MDSTDNPYDPFADQYADLIEQQADSGLFLYHNLVVPHLLDYVGEVVGLTVLDAGCGEGYVARILAGCGAHVTAVDISPRLIERARACPLHDKIVYMVHDLTQPLPGYDRCFDRVVSNMVLNDVRDYVAYIRTLGAATREGSRLILSMNNPYSAVLRGKVTNYFDSGHATEYHGLATRGVHVLYHHRTLEEYVAAFREAGFLLHRLSDVGPTEEAVSRYPDLVRYFHFPFFMVLEFIKQYEMAFDSKG